MSGSTISDRGERWLVAAADALLRPIALARLGRRPPPSPARILCLRLERIGDLMMTMAALAALRRAYPQASIDLVVGSWNRDIAGAIPGVDRVEIADAQWLARGSEGKSTLALVRHAVRWRAREYDLAINFEPDIRSNLMVAAAGARWSAGFAGGGGAPLLDLAIGFDTTKHTADNALALVEAATGEEAPSTAPRLALPDANRSEAARLLARFGDALKIGLHVNGGRAIKQWPVERFREVARHIVRDRDAVLVLTGTEADRSTIESLRAELSADRVLDLSAGADLLTVAAVLEQIDLFVTGDTGPMHIAHAVGTPIVAIFGPSDPLRYAPRGTRDRIVRVDLPCSPCNRIRLPPARCTGHTPDCLLGISATSLIEAIDSVLAEARGGAARSC
jgi:ADP-heptose:LPS heptosyltransferase